MEVEIPENGCSILESDSVFYTYRDNDYIRDKYVIYDGVVHLSESVASSEAFTYSGDCLATGDLVYEPAVNVYFPLLAGGCIAFMLFVLYRVVIVRLFP